MFPKDRIRNQRVEEIETDVEEKGKEEEEKQQKENYLGMECVINCYQKRLNSVLKTGRRNLGRRRR